MHFEKIQENILNLQFQTFQYQSISMYPDLIQKFLCEKLHVQLFLNELLKNTLSKNKRILKHVYMGNMEGGGTILTRWLRQEHSVFLCAFEFTVVWLNKVQMLFWHRSIFECCFWLYPFVQKRHLKTREKATHKIAVEKASCLVSVLLPVFFCLTVWDSNVLMR